MPQYKVIATDKETGRDIELIIDALTPGNAEVMTLCRAVVVKDVIKLASSGPLLDLLNPPPNERDTP